MKACRLEISWYILCHRAHTIPFLESGSKEAKKLLEVDIDALSSLVGLLLTCYKMAGKLKAFPNALDSLEKAISDQRWLNRISYYRALWVLISSGDKILAFHELNKIKDIHSVFDQDILSMYIDTAPEELPFIKKITIIDQILSTNPDASLVLKYITVKGTYYFLNAKKQTGIELIEVGINNFRKTKKEIDVGQDNFQLAQSLEILGEFKGDNDLLKEAQICYQREVESKTYDSFGLAMLLKHLGDSFYAEGNYPESAKYYENSLKENEDERTKIFHVNALIKLGNTDKAEELLKGIKSDGFSEFDQYDFSCALAHLALDTKKRENIDKAVTLLIGLKTKVPYFAEIRDNFLFKLKKIEK